MTARLPMEMLCGYCWRWTCPLDDRLLRAHQAVCPFVPADTRAVIAASMTDRPKGRSRKQSPQPLSEVADEPR